jgi:hypothetical protein
MATEVEMRDTALAIAIVRSRGTEIEAKGECHWCGEPVLAPKKFCDSACAEDFEKGRRR